MDQQPSKKRKLSPPPPATSDGAENINPVSSKPLPPTSNTEPAPSGTNPTSAPTNEETTEETPPPNTTTTLSSDPQSTRASRFAALRARATASQRANLAASTHEATHTSTPSSTDSSLLTTLSRRRAIASQNLLKSDLESTLGAGAFERRRAWDYTIEESERWDERMKGKKSARDNNAFRDWSAEAGKDYERGVAGMEREARKAGGRHVKEYEARKKQLIEDAAASSNGMEIIELASGELVAIDHDGKFYTHNSDNAISSTAFVASTPTPAAIDRLVTDLSTAEAIRLAKRKKRGLERDEDANQTDVTYINEKNKQFNAKLGRFYDRYTREVRESFERGSAL